MTEQESRMLIETEQRSKSNEHRINELSDEIKDLKSDQKAIYKIASSVEIIANRVSNIESKVDETNRKVDAQTQAWRETEIKINEVANEPNKHIADSVNHIKISIITAICTLLAGGLVGAIVAFMK